uniref:Caspase-8 n=1 Tax=Paralichthys olivaceus TaxID=8255 RepID=Q0WYJ4_PAROL|nr:caspase 10 [Paralichthys olivaceus]BAE98150.1 caspase 10 [Paralichthys olivaceus]
MDFQKLLLDVGKALGTDEVKALIFLCTDILDRNPTSVKSANDLFSRLAERDHLSHERRDLLTELLRTIQRLDLVSAFNLNDREPTTTSLISPYRKLLYNLYEEMTQEDLEEVKFLLYKTVPRRKLEDNYSLLDVFLKMEHMDILSDTNLSELETIIYSVCPKMRGQINQFKTQQEALQSSTQYSVDSSSTVLNSSESHLSSEMSSLSFSEHGLNSDTVSVSQESRSLPENQTSTNSEDLGIYPMTEAKRGICLIINNHVFPETSLKPRDGTMIDEECLRDVFKWLGFDVEVHLNCTREKMLSLLWDLGRRDHRQMSCVACFVLSHGLEGGVHGVDNKIVKINDLMEPLNAHNCPTLAQKPKLFFIQACQGKKGQSAVYIEADGPATSLICTDAVRDSFPVDADFLISMATVPSFVSYRDKQRGTWFIQSLCKYLIQMVPSGVDLLSILTKVNDDVSQKTDSTGEKKQMPQPAFSFRKRVVFPVPEAPSPRLPSV